MLPWAQLDNNRSAVLPSQCTMELIGMYRTREKCIYVFITTLIFCAAAEAQTKVSSKDRYTKRGRACKSLRHMTKNQPHLQRRVQGALFEQREAEKVCRKAFRDHLPAVNPTPKGGSVCRALTDYRKNSPSIKAALLKARRLERRAHSRCNRLMKQIKNEVPQRKAAGMK